MRNILFLILCCLATVACEATERRGSIDQRAFETKIISRGNNRPPFRFEDIQAAKVMVLAKEGAAEEMIRGYEFTDGVAAAPALDALLEHGFLEKGVGGGLRPTVAVMTLAEVSRAMPVGEEIVAATVSAIRDYQTSAFEALETLEGFSHLERHQYDLFLLSNGLLDNFQIGNVEAQVIEAERPARAGGNYYISVQEKDRSSQHEAFGIYGNNTGTYGGLILGVYGNQRNSQTNFHQMRELLYEEDEPIRDAALADRRTALVKALAAQWRGESVDGDQLATLKRLGYLTEQGQLAIPVITTSNYPAFNSVVTGFTPILVDLLRGHLAELTNVFESSAYADEISFEEYFMWWFHLYYSAVTDALVEEGAVHIPALGVATYLMIPDGE